MVCTNNDFLAELLRVLLKHGGKDKYNVDHIGYNARLDTLQAAVLLAKFKYIDEFNGKRKRIAAEYRRELSSLGALVLPALPGNREEAHVYHQFTVRLQSGTRSALQKHLRERGIQSMIYYPYCLHAMKVFEGRCLKGGPLVHSEAAAKEVLSIPMEPLMQDSTLREVAGAIQSFYPP